MNLGDCVHFNGTMQEVCEAGVNYRKLVGGKDQGWIIRLPCFARHKTEIKCDKCQPAQEKDIKKRNLEVLEMFAKSDKVFVLMEQLKEKHPRGSRGTEKCPNCGQKIHWRISAYNGHCHVSCENPECVVIME